MPDVRPSRWLASSLLFALAGCPTVNTVPPEDAGTTVFVGRACNVDAECGGLRCDKVRHQCICLSDESCRSSDPSAPPRYCNNFTGLCVNEVAGCKGDADCQPTEWCDPSVRTCRPVKGFCEPCTGDNQCGGAGDNCVLDTGLSTSFCGKACAVTTDCPRGATCQQKGAALQCWPDKTPAGAPATCRDFSTCTPDSLRSCNVSADCQDASQRCDLAQGKCVAVQQVCPFGTTCDPRVHLCVADCLTDADCGATTLRCVNRVCEPINECADNSQCPDTKVCAIPVGATLGNCVPSCQADADCPLGQTCQPSGTRYACTPGCSSSTSCALDQRCNTTTHLCEGPLVGSTRICQATAICRTCELCDGLQSACVVAKSQFPYCQSCTGAQDCGGGGVAACVAMLDGNYCARLCGSGGVAECPQGFSCLSLATGGQACVPSDKACTGKCP